MRYTHTMSDLNPLIRVRKHAVEQKQKFLAELYRQAEELTAQKLSLETTLAEEQEKVKDMGIEMLAYFGPYSKAVQDRIQDIEKDTAKLNARIEVAKDDMNLAFADLKKIQITQGRREEEEEREQNKKESNDLDEAALEIFRRTEKN